MADNRSRTGLWIAVTVLALMLFGSFMTNIGLLTTLFSGSRESGSDYPVDEFPSFEEEWSYGYGTAKVARIELTGVIMPGRRERFIGYEPDRVEAVLSRIRAATVDSEVKAILLEVDSPGGASPTPKSLFGLTLTYFPPEL